MNVAPKEFGSVLGALPRQSCDALRATIEIGPQLVARNAGDTLNINNALRGNAALFPPKHGRFVDIERPGQGFERQIGVTPIATERIA